MRFYMNEWYYKYHYYNNLWYYNEWPLQEWASRKMKHRLPMRWQEASIRSVEWQIIPNFFAFYEKNEWKMNGNEWQWMENKWEMNRNSSIKPSIFNYDSHNIINAWSVDFLFEAHTDLRSCIYLASLFYTGYMQINFSLNIQLYITDIQVCYLDDKSCYPHTRKYFL